MKNKIIRTENLEARYSEKTVLHNINLAVDSKKITVILGPSGCGKSTLVKNILRLYEPYKGEIEIFGKKITKMPEEEFRLIKERIGMLFQNGALLNSISIYDNVAIPLEQHTELPPEIIKKIVEVKLALVGLHQVMYSFPSELSGGMRKRAALARAIALDPQILFCDEPSAGLDPVTSESLDSLIINLKEQLDMTIVVVTHELASIHRIADKVIFLDEGRVLFHGDLSAAKKSGNEKIKQFFEVGRF